MGLKKERINQSSNPYLFKQQQTPEEEKIWLVFLQHFRLYTSMASLSKNIFLQTSKTTLSSSELYLKYHLDQRLIQYQRNHCSMLMTWHGKRQTLIFLMKQSEISIPILKAKFKDMHKYELTDFD